MPKITKFLESLKPILKKQEKEGVLGCVISAPKDKEGNSTLYEWDGKTFIERKNYTLIWEPDKEK